MLPNYAFSAVCRSDWLFCCRTLVGPQDSWFLRGLQPALACEFVGSFVREQTPTLPQDLTRRRLQARASSQPWENLALREGTRPTQPEPQSMETIVAVQTE